MSSWVNLANQVFKTVTDSSINQSLSPTKMFTWGSWWKLGWSPFPQTDFPGSLTLHHFLFSLAQAMLSLPLSASFLGQCEGNCSSFLVYNRQWGPILTCPFLWSPCCGPSFTPLGPRILPSPQISCSLLLWMLPPKGTSAVSFSGTLLVLYFLLTV